MKNSTDKTYDWAMIEDAITALAPSYHCLPAPESVINLRQYGDSDISLFGNEMGGIDTSSGMTICGAFIHQTETFEFENNWIIASHGNLFNNVIVGTTSNTFQQFSSYNIHFSFPNFNEAYYQNDDPKDWLSPYFGIFKAATSFTDDDKYSIYLHKCTFSVNNRKIYKSSLPSQKYNYQQQISSGRELITQIQQFRE